MSQAEAEARRLGFGHPRPISSNFSQEATRLRPATARPHDSLPCAHKHSIASIGASHNYSINIHRTNRFVPHHTSGTVRAALHDAHPRWFVVRNRGWPRRGCCNRPGVCATMSDPAISVQGRNTVSRHIPRHITVTGVCSTCVQLSEFPRGFLCQHLSPRTRVSQSRRRPPQPRSPHCCSPARR